jgi:hypothetical protein
MFKKYSIIFFLLLLTYYSENRVIKVKSLIKPNISNQQLSNSIPENSVGILCQNRQNCILSYSRSDYTFASIFNITLISDFFDLIIDLIPNDTIQQTQIEKQINLLKEDKFKGGRTARWYYAWVIFEGYPLHKKLIGGGFDYLEMFGKKFGESKYDWPHNPMISAFLYSGIIGGLAFVWFLIMVFVNYILYLKRQLFFFVSFLVTFFFVFFSDTSLFNTPLFAFLCVIPFFTKYLALKELYAEQKIPFKKILFW